MKSLPELTMADLGYTAERSDAWPDFAREDYDQTAAMSQRERWQYLIADLRGSLRRSKAMGEQVIGGLKIDLFDRILDVASASLEC